MHIIENDLENDEYASLRFVAYQKLNQFEMQYNDSINGTTTWIDAIKDIKEKYPKPIDEEK